VSLEHAECLQTPYKEPWVEKKEDCEKKESRQQPDVVQLISREIFHQPRWELASCSSNSRRSEETGTATLLARDSNFLYLWNGFYVYVYVSAIVYS